MKVFYFIVFLLCSGCAAPYRPPVDGPMAQVTYRAMENTGNVQIFVFDSYDCKWPMVVKAFFDNEKEQEITINVPANKPFINSFRIFDLDGSRYTATEFTPEESGQYLIVLERGIYITPGIMRIVEGNPVPENSTKKPKKVCTF